MGKIFIFHLILFQFFNYSIINCQSIVEKGTPFIKNYKPNEYGFSAQSWSIAKDVRGVMYFGCQDGILEFDGSYWRLIQTRHKSLVRSIVSDSKGTIYIGASSDFGVLSIDKKGQIKYESLCDRINIADQEFGDVWSVNSTSNGVYFFTANKVFRWFNDSITTIPLETQLFSNVINDQIYVLRKKGGIAVINDGKYSILPHTERITARSVGIIKILPYINNKLLIVSNIDGSEYRGFFIYNLDLINKISKGEKIPDSIIIPLKTDIDSYLKTNYLYDAEKIDDHNYAFGTTNGGIVIIDETGRLQRVINDNRGIQNNGIHDLFIDENKNIWAASNYGISLININSRVTQFNEQYGLKDRVKSIFDYKKEKYVGAFNGIYFLKDHHLNLNNDFYNLSKVEGYDDYCFDMISLGENLIAASNRGILQIINNKAVLKVVVPRIICFGQSNKFPDYLFLGLYPGFAFVNYSIPRPQINDRQSTELNFSEAKFLKGVPYDVKEIACDKHGDLWLATTLNGILYVKFKDNDINSYTITHFDEKNGLAQPNSISVYNINNDIIICSPDGILKVVFSEDMNSGSRVSFIREDSYGKYFNDQKADVLQVYKDTENNIWISSNKLGIVMLTLNNDDTYNYVDIPFKKISKGDFDMFYIDKENVLWVASADGLFRYDPTIDEKYNTTFNSLIRRVIVGKDSLAFNGTYYDPSTLKSGNYTLSSTNQPDQLIHEFDYKLNSIKFQFSSTYYESANSNRFQYFLQGFDKVWSTNSATPEKEYTNLPPGDYCFTVKCTNIYNTESSLGSYRFSIIPPWYNTVWAFIIYFILIVFTIYLIVNFFTKRLIAANIKLERIVSQRTNEIQKQRDELSKLNSTKDKFFSIIAHDLKNPFNNILGFSDLIIDTIKSKDLDQSLSFANIIHQTSATTFELLENLLTWSRSQSGMIQYNPEIINIKEMVANNIVLFTGSALIKGIKLSSMINKDLHVYADKNMLFTIFRNLITNAIKFSRNGDSITIEAKDSGNYIIINVSDTGIGIREEIIPKLFKVDEEIKTKGTAQEQGTGLGLILCKEFVTYNKGEIWVKSTVEKGTCFSFTLQKGNEV